jgi:hypothetical protein
MPRQTAWRRCPDRPIDAVSTGASASVGLDAKRRKPVDDRTENVAHYRSRQSAFRNAPPQDRKNSADLIIDVGVLALTGASTVTAFASMASHASFIERHWALRHRHSRIAERESRIRGIPSARRRSRVSHHL